MTVKPGLSPKKIQPKTTAQKSSVYCRGTTVAASASFNERVTRRWASMATMPRRLRQSRACRSIGAQPAGLAPTPTSEKIRAPLSCQKISVVSGVARRVRPSRSAKAKAALPTSAISAGSEKLSLDGSSAMMTPAKPTRIAVHRRQPTCSPSRNGDAAAT